jgi:type VI secretion system secreted protein Hcp
MQDFHFVMRLSKASPKLMQACASGQRLQNAVLTVRKAGKEQQEYLKITLSDVLISSYQTDIAAGAGAVPTDHISVSFAKIEFQYNEQKADGTLAGPITSGWDLIRNKAL